jgi:hypothetical protein
MEPNGAGRYDDECTVARTSANATGVLLMVFDGNRGTGFSVQATEAIVNSLPEILDDLAAEIRKLRDA